MSGLHGGTLTRPTAPVTPAFVVGHVDFAWTGDARAPGRPALSERPRVLHATLVPAPGPSEAWFQVDLHRGSRWRALCGADVLAIAPAFFDEEARWACKNCGSIMNGWLDDVARVRWELLVRPSGEHSGRR